MRSKSLPGTGLCALLFCPILSSIFSGTGMCWSRRNFLNGNLVTQNVWLLRAWFGLWWLWWQVVRVGDGIQIPLPNLGTWWGNVGQFFQVFSWAQRVNQFGIWSASASTYFYLPRLLHCQGSKPGFILNCFGPVSQIYLFLNMYDGNRLEE